MRVLVTGSAGFIGVHLSEELSRAGHEVFGHDRENGDLRRKGMFSRSLATYQPDLVVHLAAKVGRLFGEDDLIATIVDNAGITALVAQACGDAGVRLAHVSTSEIYGDGDEYVWEEADVGIEDPHNCYGLSKRWSEEACRLYAPDDLQILRLSMPYGGGHPPGRGRAALTNFLDQAFRRVPIPVHRGSERSWCFVSDTVRGIRMILEDGPPGAWNVGRDDNSLPMKKVAEMACDLVGAPHSLIEEVDPPAMQTVVKRLSTEKLRSLGWRPEVELEEGMARTLAWMREAELIAA